jgi:hypothetical protein
MWAFELLDKDGGSLLKTGYKSLSKCITQETILEDGERIIGIKGRTNSDTTALFNDF